MLSAWPPTASDMVCDAWARRSATASPCPVIASTARALLALISAYDIIGVRADRAARQVGRFGEPRRDAVAVRADRIDD